MSNTKSLNYFLKTFPKSNKEIYRIMAEVYLNMWDKREINPFELSKDLDEKLYQAFRGLTERDIEEVVFGRLMFEKRKQKKEV